MPWLAKMTIAFNNRPQKIRMKPGARMLSSANASSSTNEATSAQNPASPRERQELQDDAADRE